jgi:hypothetical protein
MRHYSLNRNRPAVVTANRNFPSSAMADSRFKISLVIPTYPDLGRKVHSRGHAQDRVRHAPPGMAPRPTTNLRSPLIPNGRKNSWVRFSLKQKWDFIFTGLYSGSSGGASHLHRSTARQHNAVGKIVIGRGFSLYSPEGRLTPPPEQQSKGARCPVDGLTRPLLYIQSSIPLLAP